MYMKLTLGRYITTTDDRLVLKYNPLLPKDLFEGHVLRHTLHCSAQVSMSFILRE